eukprot:12314081-Heterocapsa_arctica.AAC.1
MRTRALSWYARAAYASDPADGPSRLDGALVTRVWGMTRNMPVLPKLGRSIYPRRKGVML